MSKYNINFKKLAMLMLPPDLRKPLMAAIVQALASSDSAIHTSFMHHREDINYFLNHNGQVCYLRAVLNDLFDPAQRRIIIKNIPQEEDGLVIYRREVEDDLLFPLRESDDAVIFERRGYGDIGGYDFLVTVPAALEGIIDEARLSAVINTYKLVSKRFLINYA